MLGGFIRDMAALTEIYRRTQWAVGSGRACPDWGGNGQGGAFCDRPSHTLTSFFEFVNGRMERLVMLVRVCGGSGKFCVWCFFSFGGSGLLLGLAGFLLLVGRHPLFCSCSCHLSDPGALRFFGDRMEAFLGRFWMHVLFLLGICLLSPSINN
jgi:hypothetical protein